MNRISTNQIHDTAVANLQAAASRMAETQRQISTGKRLERPSDDPVAFRQIASVRDALAAIDQYRRNIDVATRKSDMADAAIGQANELMGRIAELSVQAGGGTLSATDRAAIAHEAEAIARNLVAIGNTKITDQYLFAGSAVLTKPFSEAAAGSASYAGYAGNSGVMEVAIGAGTTVAVTLPGAFPFGDAIAAIAALHTDLLANSAPSGATMAALSAAGDGLSDARGVIGARANRAGQAQVEIEVMRTAAESLRSAIEDTDIAQAASEIARRSQAYQGAISATAKLFERSIWDEVK
jgi:flagellar hook-associated protein 3 FlgL